jgi:hypothetical protein
MFSIYTFHDTGTTVGYTNDYDAVCPYSDSTSPDVVYSIVNSGWTAWVDIDLCYSTYDTKVYVYDQDLNLIACNDDYYFSAPCWVYASRLESVPLQAGFTYYIVVDGYGGESGNYDLVVTCVGCDGCYLPCPTPSTPEGEPALFDGYVDNYDGGCNSPPDYPFKDLTWTDGNPDHPDEYGNLVLCGDSGWYLSASGTNYRDTDWYVLQMGPGGEIDVTVDGELPTYFFELGPQDCANVGVVQSATGGACNEDQMTITGYAELTSVWFWAGPTVFTSPSGTTPYTYRYICWFSGLAPGPIATQSVTWSTLKAVFE